jgi:hypothetical protein
MLVPKKQAAITGSIATETTPAVCNETVLRCRKHLSCWMMDCTDAIVLVHVILQCCGWFDSVNGDSG